MSAFDSVYEWSRRWEGGFQVDPKDPGNWTGGRVGVGTLIGTSRGVSAAYLRRLRDSGADYPADPRQLSDEQVRAIYRGIYDESLASAYEDQPGLAAAVFDLFLHSGAGNARKVIEAATMLDPGSGQALELEDLIAARLNYLTALTELWPRFGRGWVRRVADLLAYADRVRDESAEKPPPPSRPPPTSEPPPEPPEPPEGAPSPPSEGDQRMNIFAIGTIIRLLPRIVSVVLLVDDLVAAPGPRKREIALEMLENAGLPEDVEKIAAGMIDVVVSVLNALGILGRSDGNGGTVPEPTIPEEEIQPKVREIRDRRTNEQHDPDLEAFLEATDR